MMFHHLASGLLWPYAFLTHKCICPVAYFMCTEASNIFLNIRWFFAEHGIQGNLRMAIDVAFFISFSLLRILSLLPALYLTTRIDWPLYFEESSLFQVFLTFFLLVPFCLNLFWYKIIIKSARKALFTASSVPGGTAKNYEGPTTIEKRNYNNASNGQHYPRRSNGKRHYNCDD